jgi:hypothetical protein
LTGEPEACEALELKQNKLYNLSISRGRKFSIKKNAYYVYIGAKQHATVILTNQTVLSK